MQLICCIIGSQVQGYKMTPLREPETIIIRRMDHGIRREVDFCIRGFQACIW